MHFSEPAITMSFCNRWFGYYLYASHGVVLKVSLYLSACSLLWTYLMLFANKEDAALCSNDTTLSFYAKLHTFSINHALTKSGMIVSWHASTRHALTSAEFIFWYEWNVSRSTSSHLWPIVICSAKTTRSRQQKLNPIIFHFPSSFSFTHTYNHACCTFSIRLHCSTLFCNWSNSCCCWPKIQGCCCWWWSRWFVR